MTTLTKKEAIIKIVANDKENILHGEEDGLSYLDDILTDGFEGWSNYTRNQLQEELDNRFEHGVYKIEG